MDPKFLTYNGVVLRRSDVRSLEDCNYLNDAIIDFYFAYLFESYQSDDILLVPTSISFLLGNAPDWDTFIATVESLNFHEKKLIFFTVNDNSNFSSSGGSHWSLLVYCRKRNLFMHYDSLHMMNNESAFAIYESVNSYISYDSAEFMECRAPRQRNGYDCGLYVMEIARVIYERYFNFDQFQNEDEICGSFNVVQRVNCKHVESNMRSEMLQLILGLNQ
ncbi:NEDD8-specific protease 1-like [Cucurbita maxima]|uniref:NEDD8-specific protease 1-like n=1 Tax=Cucurbita maxima TaxID=3661 RepID=A0A6J1JKF6_CUCMA|nr:NEDD8-specific protease 1-like [Cucurbita maxima]